MFAALRSVFRAGAACCALVLSTAGPILAGELEIAASDSCEGRNEQNIPATFSTAREQIRLREQLVADLKSIRSELTSERTWWGGDPTSDTSLAIAVVLRTIKTKTDLIFDLAEIAAAGSPQARAACAISVVKSSVERVVLGEGDNVGIGVKAAQCINKTPKNVFFDTVDTLEKIEKLANNIERTVDLTKKHGDLKDEVERQTARLDRQIGQYEESNRQARARLEEMERELRQAIRAYCDENDAKAAEELQRVMDQTRAGASTIAARHRQVIDRVDAAREQRSSALTQQMQGTLQLLQQQQLMLLQQQQLREQLEHSQQQPHPAYHPLPRREAPPRAARSNPPPAFRECPPSRGNVAKMYCD